MEIVVRGGLGPGVAPIASFSGRHWDAAPDEPFEAFRARAKAAAEAEMAPFIVFGGLPNVSKVPADSETQADAGALRIRAICLAPIGWSISFKMRQKYSLIVPPDG
jgi:hypothetical protein